MSYNDYQYRNNYYPCNHYYNNCCCHTPPNYYCCPVWIKGEPGSIGPTGPQGPLAPESFVQLFDRNYTNELTSNINLNLSNEGINPIYSTGEYTLTTTAITNDTLNLPEPGLYLISISLHASFLQPVNPGDTFGVGYQILFNILNENNSSIGNLSYMGIIPKDPNAVIETQLSTQFLYNVIGATPSLKILLSNFNFALAFENKLSVYDIIFIVQKWEKP